MFRVGDFVKRKPTADLKWFWKNKCEKFGLNPEGVFKVSKVADSGDNLCLEGFEETNFIVSKFDLAVPLNKTLEDYL
jgi:hypothetical protein